MDAAAVVHVVIFLLGFALGGSIVAMMVADYYYRFRAEWTRIRVAHVDWDRRCAQELAELGEMRDLLTRMRASPTARFAELEQRRIEHERDPFDFGDE